MTRLIFAAAALAVAAFCTAEPSAARSVTARHTQAAAQPKAGDCVRAPNVGSFATAPFTQPPCMPGTMH